MLSARTFCAAISQRSSLATPGELLKCKSSPLWSRYGFCIVLIRKWASSCQPFRWSIGCYWLRSRGALEDAQMLIRQTPQGHVQSTGDVSQHRTQLRGCKGNKWEWKWSKPQTMYESCKIGKLFTREEQTGVDSGCVCVGWKPELPVCVTKSWRLGCCGCDPVSGPVLFPRIFSVVQIGLIL